ncbi:hypothetical protein J2X69_002807 [Algoriphagus sp. 4150]|nr:hypothetical protein [Algoriphagus sp. 4150]
MCLLFLFTFYDFEEFQSIKVVVLDLTCYQRKSVPGVKLEWIVMGTR